MTYGPVARRATFNLQRRSWLMNREPDKQRRALGKGLSALLPKKAVALPEPPAEHSTPGTRVASVPIVQIEPNPLQPRTVFDPGRLQELANSIETHGVIQPILVRRKDSHFELIAGEDRKSVV